MKFILIRNRYISCVVFLFFIVFVFSFIGCSDELIIEDDNSYKEQMVSFKIVARVEDSTEEGLSEESRVETLRLIAYQYFEGQYKPSQLVNIFTKIDDIHSNIYQIVTQVPKGMDFRFFLIANEKNAWELDNPGKTAVAIKNLLVDYLEDNENLNINPPFPMFAESETIESDNYIIQEVSLVRTVAKISLSVKGIFADIVGLNGGSLRMDQVSIQRLPKNPYLVPGMLFHSSEDAYFVQTVTKPLKLTSVFEDGDIAKGFVTEPDNELVFYVPEYILKDKNLYTYIHINGQYTPVLGENKNIMITYSIPVGDGVQKLYENNNYLSVTNLSNEDLKITRNKHYRFDATVRSLGELDGMQLYITAEPWKSGGEVNGDIETKPYLNVAMLETSFVNGVFTPEKLYFWSNQPQDSIFLDSLGETSDGNTLVVSDFFVVNTVFVNSSQSNGYIQLYHNNSNPAPDGEYHVFLNAGNLRREIKIRV